MIRMFEAFSGYGSQSLAMKNIGVDFEVVGISEIDKWAIKAYEDMHGPVKNYGDISKIDPNELPDMDLFTYSFPCTDISLAGKQKGLGRGETRSGLLWECEKVIEAKKPKYLLMENVKPLVGNKFKKDFDVWCAWLRNRGYTNYWKVLNASDYGIPQNRERVFMVSILGEHDTFSFPEPIKLTRFVGDMLEEKVDQKYYLTEEQLTKVNNWNSYQNPFDQVLGYKTIIPTIMTRYDNCASMYLFGNGEEKINLRNEIQLDPKNVHKKYNIRKFTPKELFALMGVRSEYYDKINGISDVKLYKMAGNSIVVNVLEAIFTNMFKPQEKKGLNKFFD